MDAEMQQLVQTIMTWMSPILGSLQGAGGKVLERWTEKAADELGDAAWKQLKPVFEAEAVEESLEGLAKDPADEEARGRFERALVEVLKERPDLERRARSVMSTYSGTTVIASGENSVAAGPGGLAVGRVDGGMTIHMPGKS